ncbi:toxin-antitoxin system YwqK family antitoxin [Catalinimonas niigatensis]|uniref:toxin-antitoxin system YwqK family antitoxin n=1 Tax=Catalinimonas niigatensis TaxID=1397264 RepID=UPI0026662EA9|nr:hypothetical protein [Catalinimonas niigatensis]WPP51347.1 hypothetical protein PZB72_02970 [Catalinimonas niigatensis]
MINICCLAGLSLLGLGCSSQIKNELTIRKASDAYPNGQKKFDGKFLECVRNDTYVPELLIFEKKKFGKWTAYNEDGSILETREYTSNVEDCQTAILKQGAWKYFNHEGILYLTEHYRNDTLMQAEWEMYEGNSPIGTVFKSDIHVDSMVYLHDKHTGSLLNNASFDQYFFKPILIVNDGQDQIQSLIPFWYSPDGATPDYYHPYRSVEDVPQHFRQDSSFHALNGQVGLVLFLDVLKEKYQSSNVTTNTDVDYTEAIQSRLNQPLEEGQHYCFHVDIRLSEHAGCSINQFGALLTQEAVSFDRASTLSTKSISFERPLRNTDHWETLCSTYTARGGEMYLTLGRLTDVSDTKVIRREPKSNSSLDVNRAAYYLIDHVELYPISLVIVIVMSLP